MDNHETAISTDLQSPLLILADVLCNARDAEGQISIPSAMIKTIKSRLGAPAGIPAIEVQSMVAALDSRLPSLCSRLTLDAFVVIVAILRASERCLAQERGLYLLTQSLQDSHGKSLDVEAAIARKAAIGAKILASLLVSFGDVSRPDRVRRWMGLLAGELLKDCEENKDLVGIGPEDTRRALGRIVTGDRSQTVRLIAGTIIQGMISSGIPEQNLWPIGTDKKIFADFPRSQPHTSQWVVEFEDYLDNMFSQGISTDEPTDMLFAYGVDTGHLKYSATDEPAVLVTVTDDLGIMVPASAIGPAAYMDIPLQNISKIIIETPGNESQRIAKRKSTTNALRLHMSELSNHTFYLNASEYSSGVILLTLQTPEDAIDLRNWILEAQVRPRISHSQPLDVSQGAIENLETIASAAEAHSTFSRGDTGVHAPEHETSATQDIRAVIVGSAPLDQEVVPDSVPQAGMDATVSTRISSGSSVIAVSAFEEQTGGQSKGFMLSFGKSVQHSSGAPACSRQFDDFPEHGLTSSAQWAKSLKLVDNAPELQVDISESTVLKTKSVAKGADIGVDTVNTEKPIRPAAAVERILTSGGGTNHRIGDATTNGGLIQTVEERTYAHEDDIDHASLYEASPRRSTTEKAYTKPKQLMLDGSVDKTRTSTGQSRATGTPVETNGRLPGSLRTSENTDMSALPRTKITQRMRNGNDEIVASSKSATAAFKPKSTARKKFQSRAEKNTTRAAARPRPDVSHEDLYLFDVPESPDRPKRTKPINERAPKGDKATKTATKPAVTGAKVAAGAPAKPQHKASAQLPESSKPQNARDANWDNDFDLNDDKEESGTVQKKVKSTKSKPPSSSKGGKGKIVERRSSPIEARLGRSMKKKNIADSKVAVAKRQSAPVALIEHRTRRAAAVKANNRIQGLDDDTVDPPDEAPQGGIVTDEPPSDAYRNLDAESDQGRLREQGSNLVKSPPVTDQPLHTPFQSSTPTKDLITDEDELEAANTEAIVSPLSPQAASSPEDIKLLRRQDTNAPVQFTQGGRLGGEVALAVQNGSEKENPERAMGNEDLATVGQPIDHYFDDAIAYADKNSSDHEPDVIQLKAPVMDIGSGNERGPEQRPADQGHKAHVNASPARLKEAPNSAVKIKEPTANKLRAALSGLMDVPLQMDDLPETKESLPQASARFQPRMTEKMPDSKDTKAKEIPKTRLRKPSYMAIDDKREDTTGRDRITSKYSSKDKPQKNLVKIERPELAQTAQNNGTSQVDHNVVTNDAGRSKSQESDVINISSEDGEMSEYFSDGAGENGVPEALSGDLSELFPPIPIAPMMVAVKPKPKPITVPKIITALKSAVAPKAVATPVPPAAKRRQSNDQDEVDVNRVTKKSKAAMPTKIIRKTTPSEKAGTPAPTEVTPVPLTDDHVHRKSNLISFNARGPRNQGLPSVQKPRKSAMTSNEVNPQVYKEKESGVKRRWAGEAVATARLVKTPEEKRRKLSVVIPRTHASVARLSTGMSSPDMLELSPKPSSQGTRVNENGSPRPIAKIPRNSDEWAEGVLKRLQASEESPISHQMEMEDRADPAEVDGSAYEEVNLPTLSKMPLPDQDEEKFSSIRKQLPSSPTAPSQLLVELTAHRLQPGGKFVNVKTESTVKPSILQDPFSGNVHRRPSSFMDRLRAQSNLAQKPEMNDAEREDPARRVNIAPILADDPDKTLVGAEPVNSSPSLREDTSSQSSHTSSPFLHFQLTDSETEHDATKQWRQALQPYQRSQLDILYNISNRLVRHLIDQETAIADIIEDYRRGGTRLIEELEKTHQEEYRQYQAGMQALSLELVKIYTETKRKLVKRLAAVKESPVAKLEERWRAEQDVIKGKLEAALLACRE